MEKIKVFVCVPHTGRKELDVIKSESKVHRLTDVLLGADEIKPAGQEIDIEYINYSRPISPDIDRKTATEYLVNAINKLKDCDYLAETHAWEFPDMDLLSHAARVFGKEVIEFPLEYVCPDVIEERQKRYKESECGEICDAPSYPY